ncbi:hypothetical protein GCM10011414_00130 [Croceivirga lutea]|nr:hypothetical protein GCM10011414_00130 [Croceivirga lutea]
MFKIINAAITPGTQPQNVKSRTIKNDPQPLPITDKGGKIIANKTRRKLIDLIDVPICRKTAYVVTVFTPVF